MKGDKVEDKSNDVEIPFKPSRVILQDFTGVPAVVDFAGEKLGNRFKWNIRLIWVFFVAMRDAVLKLGGDPEKINPICPSDLVIDHSVQVRE